LCAAPPSARSRPRVDRARALVAQIDHTINQMSDSPQCVDSEAGQIFFDAYFQTGIDPHTYWRKIWNSFLSSSFSFCFSEAAVIGAIAAADNSGSRFTITSGTFGLNSFRAWLAARRDGKIGLCVSSRHLEGGYQDTRGALAIKPFLERDLRDPPGRVQVDALTPGAPDATPPVAQAPDPRRGWRLNGRNGR